MPACASTISTITGTCSTTDPADVTALGAPSPVVCFNPTLSPSAPTLAPQQPVDRDRFLGRWYIIANVPYFFERDKVGSYVEYRARDDGRVDDYYFARDDSLNTGTGNQSVTIVDTTPTSLFASSPLFFPGAPRWDLRGRPRLADDFGAMVFDFVSW